MYCFKYVASMLTLVLRIFCSCACSACSLYAHARSSHSKAVKCVLRVACMLTIDRCTYLLFIFAHRMKITFIMLLYAPCICNFALVEHRGVAYGLAVFVTAA